MLALDFDVGAALAHPYPGLRSFEPSESFLFFGRQFQTNELLRRLSVGRMLAVVGTSGSGKSSLVRAGLLPALYRGHLAGAGSAWRIAVMRPGGKPLDRLADALVAAELFAEANREHVRKTIGLTSMGLVDAVGGADPHLRGGLLLVVDQFEELFRFRTEQDIQDGGAEAVLFVASLLEAVDQIELPIYVVLTMRSDFLGDCAQFSGLPEALNHNHYLVPRLTREDRQEAIEGPIRVAGARITVRLVQRVLNDAGEDPDQLPVLQHALMATFREWKKNGGKGDIDLQHYEKAGTLADAINRDAKSVFESLPVDDQAAAQRIFRCLTTTEGGRAIRRPARLDRIFAVVGASGDSAGQARVERIIQQFASGEHSFLVLPAGSQLQGDSVVDVTHESLIRKWTMLREWVKDEAESVDWYQSVVRGATLYEARSGALWRDPDLKQALLRCRREHWNQAWAGQYSAGFESATRFLQKSKSKQRRSRILLGSAIGFISLAAVAGYGKYRHELDKDQAQELMLRKQLDDTGIQQAEAAGRMRTLQVELASMRDPVERKTLEQQFRDQTQRLAILKVQSANTANALDKHKGDQGSQDSPVLKDAYAQIDNLQAQLNAFRQGQCSPGYVWREASEVDHVCVTSAVRRQVELDNSQASERRAGGGEYGPETCKQGYVWRDAFPGDHVCVQPSVREEAASDNRQAQCRLATTPETQMAH